MRKARRTGVVVPCAALVALGCAVPAGPAAAVGGPVAVTRPVAVGVSVPGAVGVSVPGALKPIDAEALRVAVERAAKELLVPGALVLLRTPQGTFRVGVGTAELGADRAPASGDHFRIASNTKTMTAALIMLLAQDGRLRLGDPVSSYVAGVPNGEHITIAELLEMRSGLYNYTNAPELATMMDADPGKAVTPQAMLDLAFRRPPGFAPGASYEYSNTNYTLLGLVAEKAGGRPLAQQLRDRLFAPLGLKGTALPAADDTSLPRPYAHGYMYGGTAHALTDLPYPADVQAAARSGRLRPVDYTRQNPSYATAAGGAVSTADDLATWIRALVTGKVLDPASQRQWIHSPKAEDPARPDGQKYGYGIAYQRFGPNAAMYYHGGELPGFNSFIGHDPDNDVTLVVWANLTLSPDGRTTANALLPAILKQVYTSISVAAE
ncbi:serine hydrolase domain-containing protein [Streptomyces sp. NPDC059564]|uniref:serine hydrolase domain-containing protein n=1 Tax=Streptomyces sp. NPDC059564 TaxID=3346865 RepID=UPI00368F53E3